MKQVSLIINIILLFAVGFLYYKHYSQEEEVVIPVSGQAAASRIVFVNSDSLMESYSLFKAMQDRMEKKRDSLDQLLTSRGNALEREIKDYQSKAEGMSAGERQLREESLMRKQQALMEDRDNLLDKLKNEEAALTDTLHADLMNYLKVFNKGHQYDFILGYSRGGGILLASDSLDVTKQVLRGLNKN
ncbi:MAG: OmpH family outer membrane protein [Bacteroidia bacterium]|nr:OmpH family outer membrane protein [Bacteroidia bacterium]